MTGALFGEVREASTTAAVGQTICALRRRSVTWDSSQLVAERRRGETMPRTGALVDLMPVLPQDFLSLVDRESLRPWS